MGHPLQNLLLSHLLRLPPKPPEHPSNFPWIPDHLPTLITSKPPAFGSTDKNDQIRKSVPLLCHYSVALTTGFDTLQTPPPQPITRQQHKPLPTSNSHLIYELL